MVKIEGDTAKTVKKIEDAVSKEPSEVEKLNKSLPKPEAKKPVSPKVNSPSAPTNFIA